MTEFLSLQSPEYLLAFKMTEFLSLLPRTFIKVLPDTLVGQWFCFLENCLALNLIKCDVANYILESLVTCQDEILSKFTLTKIAASYLNVI